jgi:protein-L-isoaspartate(D-aspartate) O-methyltransferase
MSDFAARRARMVKRQLRARGIADERVLAAMEAAPRERFLPPARRSQAYADSALPIAGEQTISQPWIVAAICQALELRGGERVLEVGTGSGYSTYVLSLLAAEVLSVERLPELAAAAAAALHSLGAANVELLLGDGGAGVPGRAPFDAIAVHAAAPAPPPALLGQLADGGRMVVPIVAGEAEALTVLRRHGAEVEVLSLGPCRFVPLIGEGGFGEDWTR